MRLRILVTLTLLVGCGVGEQGQEASPTLGPALELYSQMQLEEALPWAGRKPTLAG